MITDKDDRGPERRELEKSAPDKSLAKKAKRQIPRHRLPRHGRQTRIAVDVRKAPDGATGVDFHFTLSGPITRGNYVVAAKPAGPGLLRFRWQPKKHRNELPTELLLDHLDNPPRLLATPQWYPAKGAKPLLPPPLRWDRYAERERRIKQATHPRSPLRTKALAIMEFDKATDPDYLQHHGHADTAKQVRELTNYLRFRWLQRAGWAVHDRAFEPIAQQDKKARATAKAVEKLARQALRHAFPHQGDPDGINLPLLEATFAAFVAGELRMTKFAPPPGPDPLADDGIPDGDYYFSFAESALLFGRLGLHAEFWLRVLPIFVCGDGFFASYFWNRKTRRRDAYRPDNCKTDAEVSSTAILVWHEQRFRTMSPAQLAAEHSRAVGIAVCKDPARPRPVCTAKEFA